MKILKELNIKDKRVLVRCDLDVPLSGKGIVLDDFRLKKTLPTIEYLIANKCKVILMGHLDRPKGEIVESLKMNPVKNKLSELLGIPVIKVDVCIGKEVEEQTHRLKAGEVLLLENLRFYKEEEENNDVFAKELSKLAEVYINEAFSSCHRAHASIVGISKHLPAGAGLSLQKEIEILTNLIKSPQKPLVAIVNGKKIETKTKLIDSISEIADYVIIGGLIKKDKEEKGIVFKYLEKIIEPVEKENGKDITEETINLFKEKIKLAKTIFWNGPLGMIEKEEFSRGTEEVMKSIIESGAFSVIGGGDTVAFINKHGLIDKFSHVSTGGGALLAFIADGSLVGVEALK